MNIKQLPNILSLFRIFIVPLYLAGLYLIKGQTGIIIALVLFIVAGITDFLDGYLARKLDCITELGKIIDPLADKLIVCAALISLVFEPINVISIYPVLIIFIREFVVTVVRKSYSKKQIYISANYWGKIKTVLQMGGIIIALLFTIAKDIIQPVKANEMIITFYIQLFFWVVVVITVVSGISYLTDLRKKKI